MCESDLWIFGYGSLIWDPGFEFEEKIIARMDGYTRRFCMRSIHHRGTPDHNGLVLALDEKQDSYCDGVAFRVAGINAEPVLDYLRERELISSAYLEVTSDILLSDGRVAHAVTYVVDRDHEQYCQIHLEEQAKMISTAVGGRGPNHEYLSNTAKILEELGLKDSDLDWLVRRVEELRS